MINAKFAPSIVLALCLITLSVAAPVVSALPAQTSDTEKTIWDLEHSYWRYVEANDLASYRNLWHADFLGWPSVSAVPLHKDHITDWITSQTSAGRSFKLVAFKSAAIQSSTTTVVVCYWTDVQMDRQIRQRRRTHRPRDAHVGQERQRLANYRRHVDARNCTRTRNSRTSAKIPRHEPTNSTHRSPTRRSSTRSHS